MKKLGIAVLSLVSILGILYLGYQFRLEGQRRGAEDKQYAEMEKELNPLSVRKREVERELRNLETKKSDEVKAKGSTVLLFTDMNKQIYKKAYPTMQEYDFKGVLLLSEETYPGAEGCMTKEQFDELIGVGWSYCVRWAEAKDVAAWHKKQETFLQSLGLEHSEAVYFPKGTYKKEYEEPLKKAGYKTIAHCGDAEMDYITVEVTDSVWYAGTYGMNGQGPRNFLEKAIEKGGAIAYRVGFSEEEEKYEDETFKSMLRWMDTYQDEKKLQVVDFSEAQTFHKELTKKRNQVEANMGDEEMALREELDLIDQQIDEVYSKYF